MYFSTIKTIVFIALIIWSYYLVYALYIGLIIHPFPELGDGLDYHLPIAQTILDGSFLHPSDYKLPQWYYPGSGQLINSLFLLFNIPIPLSNIFAVILLFILCFKLALVFGLRYYYSILFGITIVTINAVSRWYNDMSLDVLVAVFFVWGIILLEDPKKTYKYFTILGFVFGMLIGSKYSAIFYGLLLLVVYGKKLLSVLSISHFAIFLIPFSFFGLFWYIRNYIYMNNPFYPIPIFGLPGKDIFGGHTVLNVMIKDPLNMANAFYSEYNIWSILVVILLVFYLYQTVKQRINILGLNKLYILGFSSLCFYLFNPTSYQPWIMVSSFRYSYPAMIPLILCMFILVARYKQEVALGFISIGSMIMTLSMAYYPKLTPVYLSLAFIVNYLINRYEKTFTHR